MASAHPTPEMLSGYAVGAASDGVALLVATHLSFCPECRARVAALEATAGALFADSEPAAPAEGAGAAVLARLDAPEPTGETAATPDSTAAIAGGPDLPRPILHAIGAPIVAPRWRFRMPGVSEIALPGAEGERVSLLRVRPGAGVPAHTHTAVEATLVLRGALVDGETSFAPGDVSVATEADDHHPRAGGEDDCVCLTVLTGGLRFTGAFGRALNLFTE